MKKIIITLCLMIGSITFAQNTDITILKTKANNGDADAQNNLGTAYYNGEGVEKSYPKAVYWWKKAAEQGDAKAQINLGDYYYDSAPDGTFSYIPAPDNYVPISAKTLANQKNSIKNMLYWYEKAAEQGNIDAQLKLSDYYGIHEQNYKKSTYWLKKAAEQGNVFAQTHLGIDFSFGENEDYSQAVYWYKKAAEQGDANAQKNLGDIYYNGEGVEQSYSQAIYWWEKAADQVNVDSYDLYNKGIRVGNISINSPYYAKIRLGELYAMGEGVIQNEELAIYWLSKNTDNISQAYFELGDIYYRNKNYTKAIYWLKKINNNIDYLRVKLLLAKAYYANKSYADAVQCYEDISYKDLTPMNKQMITEAQFYLGLAYYNGEGMEQSKSQAVYWWNKAAEHGNANAQFNLGVAYDNGEGVEQSSSKAIYWWKKILENNKTFDMEKDTQYALGLAYYNSKGIKQSKQKALYWLRKACNNQKDEACDLLNKIK